MSRRLHPSAADGRKRVSRRRFLAATGTVLGGLAVPTIIPASALGAEGKVAPSDRIGVAMIGLGARRRRTTWGRS